MINITELHGQTLGYEISIEQAINRYVHNQSFASLLIDCIKQAQEKYKLGDKFPSYKQISNSAYKIGLKIDVFYNADVHALVAEYIKKSANRYSVSVERYDARNGAAYYMNAKSCWLNPSMAQYAPAQAFLADADSYAIIIREDNRNIARFWGAQIDEDTFVLFNFYGYYAVQQAFRRTFGLRYIDVTSNYVYLNDDAAAMSNYPYSICVDEHIEYDESDIVIGTTYDNIPYTEYDVEYGIVVYSEMYYEYISRDNAVLIIRLSPCRRQQEHFVLSEDAVKLHNGNYGYRYDCVELHSPLHNGQYEPIVEMHNGEYAHVNDCVQYNDTWYLTDTLADYGLFVDSYGYVHSVNDDNVTWLNGCPITQSDANKILGQLSLWD